MNTHFRGEKGSTHSLALIRSNMRGPPRAWRLRELHRAGDTFRTGCPVCIPALQGARRLGCYWAPRLRRSHSPQPRLGNRSALDWVIDQYQVCTDKRRGITNDPKAAVMGSSGSGPTALQFALRHPDRLWCLVLQSAVTQRFIEPHRSTHSLLGPAVFSRSGQWRSDLGAWAVYLLGRYWPSLLVRTLLNASEDLDRDKARQRRSYVRQHPEERTFFRRVIASGLPLSVRQTGLWNDLHQYADLPV